MKKIKEYLLITFGFIIVAFGIKLFLEPNNIAGGGVMGIAIIIHSLIPRYSVGLLMTVMNIVLFVAAIAFVGGKFGAKTIYASLGMSGVVWLLDKFTTLKPVTSDLMLATLFGTIISGIGMGIVFNQNASTGGTDIIAKMLNKFFHLDIGKALLLVDVCVTLFAGAALGADLGMFSLLSAIITGITVDNFIEGINRCKQVMIISNESNKISQFIIKDLNRGCTMINGKGGYTWNDTMVIYTVLGRGEFIKLRSFIKEIDKDAFITVSDAREVLGEGFQDIVGEDY